MPTKMTRQRPEVTPDASAVAQASYRRRYGFANQCSVGLGTFGQIVPADYDVDSLARRGIERAGLTQAGLVSGLTLTMTRALESSHDMSGM